MMSIWYRSIVLGGILAVAACGSYDDGAARHPVPSAARGGVFPSAIARTSMPAPAPETTPDIVEAYTPSPAAVAAAARQAAAIPAPAPAPVPPVQVAAAPPIPESRVPDVDMTAPPVAPPVMPPAPPPVAAAPAAPSAQPTPIPAAAVVAPVAAPVPVAAPAPAATTVASGDRAREYILGTGDEIRLTVYGEDDLSGQYQIGSAGIVALPLVGNVEAAGHTIGQFEAAVRDKLMQGYLKDPRVSVQVANYRPFFILGEVARPGSYPYVNGMTVLSAVASAGGYTYRADTGDIRVRHPNAADRQEQDIDESDPVMPGDIIRVTERFF